MGMECGECERDLRGGHDASCSRYKPQVCPVCCDSLEDGDGYMWCKKHGEVDPLTNKAAIKEIARLNAERDAALAGTVKVKPLVWEDDNIAYAMGAKWMAWPYTDPLNDGRGNWMWQCIGAAPHRSGRCRSEAAAKAAAQADYEARILAAIQTDTEAVEMAGAAAFSAGFEAGQRAEREACAVLIETRDGSIPYRQEIAAAIRKRGEGSL